MIDTYLHSSGSNEHSIQQFALDPVEPHQQRLHPPYPSTCGTVEVMMMMVVEVMMMTTMLGSFDEGGSCDYRYCRDDGDGIIIHKRSISTVY